MKIIRLLQAILLITAIASCSKNSGTVKPSKTDSTITPITVGTISGGTGVYVAGYEKFYHVGADSLAVSAGVPNVAKVWKNGVAVNLTNGTYDAGAAAVYANKTDVYVAGYEKNSAGFKVATLWKNGVANRLGDGSKDTYATSLAIDGSNVYVTGIAITNSLATGSTAAGIIWKNGVGSVLPNSSTANSVAVYGGKVYVCGNDTVLIPTLWTNGVGVKLLGAGIGPANSIFISSTGERYIGGDFENNGTVAGFWHNEKFAFLGVVGTVYPPGEVKAVFVSGMDVYLLGFNDYGTVLWKNTVATQIDDNSVISAGKSYAGNLFTSISVSAADNTIYLGGWRASYVNMDYTGIHNVEYPLLWSNGKGNVLDNGDSPAIKKAYNKTGGRVSGVWVVN